jgi:hypothetical protein
MTVIAIHAPLIELRRDESVSLREAAEQKAAALQQQQHQQQQQQQHLEYEEMCNSPDPDMNSYKSVRFSIQPTTVIEYLSRKDMTPQEKTDTWMTARDLEPIRQEMQFTRSLVNTCFFDGDNLELTKRGLELRQRRLVRTCRSVVIQEQYRQTMNGSENQVLIASSYAFATNGKPAAIAHMRGTMDEEEVTNMYLPERLAKEEAEGFGYYGSMNPDEADDTDDDESFSSDDSNEDDE